MFWPEQDRLSLYTTLVTPIELDNKGEKMESVQSEINSMATKLLGPVLVIGASGFVGVNILRSILAVREDVIGTFCTAKGWRLQDISDKHLYQFDKTSQQSITNMIRDIRPKTILDVSTFGAYYFEQDAKRIHNTNYMALLQLVDALKGHDIVAYIHAGSTAEYGFNVNFPDEDASYLIHTHYGVSKRAASVLIQYFGKIEKFPIVNMRLWSVYGPYEDSCKLIPLICQKSLDGKLPQFARPEVSRDQIHVFDVIRAFIMTALQMREDIYGESFNIGSGTYTTLKEFAALSKELFGVDEEPVYSSDVARPFDVVDYWYGNCEKAKQMLGFKTKIPLRAGLVHTQEWWRKQLTFRSIASMTKK